MKNAHLNFPELSFVFRWLIVSNHRAKTQRLLIYNDKDKDKGMLNQLATDFLLIDSYIAALDRG